jgi:hypothetical protein
LLQVWKACPCSKIYPWGDGSPMKHVADDFASVQ